MSRGRPVGWRKAESNQRLHKQLRAFPEEWDAIKEFMYIVRKIGAEEAQMVLKIIKEQYKIEE